jgi:hypothetical protein
MPIRRGNPTRSSRVMTDCGRNDRESLTRRARDIRDHDKLSWEAREHIHFQEKT